MLAPVSCGGFQHQALFQKVNAMDEVLEHMKQSHSLEGYSIDESEFSFKYSVSPKSGFVHPKGMSMASVRLESGSRFFCIQFEQIRLSYPSRLVLQLTLEPDLIKDLEDNLIRQKKVVVVQARSARQQQQCDEDKQQHWLRPSEWKTSLGSKIAISSEVEEELQDVDCSVPIIANIF